MHLVAHITELWRYPVKSMGGEPCTTLDLTLTGIAGDRRFAFTSPRAPAGYPLLHSTERTTMLRATATLTRDGQPKVHPLNALPLTITDPNLPQAIDPTATLTLLESETPLTDVRPVALHSTQTIAQLSHELGRPFDPRRLRSNIILTLLNAAIPPPATGLFPEDALTTHTLQLGPTATLRITERIPRCRIVSLAPETATHDPTLLRQLAQAHNGRAGIYARPLTPGPLTVGDPIYLLDERTD